MASLAAGGSASITVPAGYRLLIRPISGCEGIYQRLGGTQHRVAVTDSYAGPYGVDRTVSLSIQSGTALYYLLDSNQALSAADRTISADLALPLQAGDIYNGATLLWSTAAVLTLPAGLPLDFGLVCIPPASGNASVAAGSGVTLNGAGTTLTRAASNVMFSVVQSPSSVNAYVVSGS